MTLAGEKPHTLLLLPSHSLSLIACCLEMRAFSLHPLIAIHVESANYLFLI